MAGDLIKSIGQNLAGDIKKAIIFVRDPAIALRGMPTLTSVSTEGEDKDSLNKTALKNLNTYLKSRNNKGRRLSSLSADNANSLQDNSNSNSNDMQGIIDETNLGSSGFVAVEIQYNPSSINIRTSKGAQYSRGEDDVKIIESVEQSILSMQLMFDDCNVQDAFMLQNLTPNVGNIVSMGKDIYTSNADDKGYNVQKIMDGFIGMLQHEQTRFVIFMWNDMIFPGEVTRVSARYTMFNKKGNPVRGSVELEITQDKDTADKYWIDRFINYFSEDRSQQQGMGSSLANGNLFNLNNVI